MKLSIIFTAVLCCSVIGCATNAPKNVERGMTEAQVQKIMGKSRNVRSSLCDNGTPDDCIRTWQYEKKSITFIGGKVTGIHNL